MTSILITIACAWLLISSVSVLAGARWHDGRRKPDEPSVRKADKARGRV